MGDDRGKKKRPDQASPDTAQPQPDRPDTAQPQPNRPDTAQPHRSYPDEWKYRPRNHVDETAAIYRRLERPILTEKSQAIEGKYWFVVEKSATKIDIRDSVERLFDVEVSKVNTKPLFDSGRGRGPGRGRQRSRSRTKKIAIVTLARGEIDFWT